VEPTNIGVSPMFVAKPPRIPPACAGIVENIYQNVSVKNAFRIIAPCDFAREKPRLVYRCTFLG
jgi:hypothetical protein